VVLCARGHGQQRQQQQQRHQRATRSEDGDEDKPAARLSRTSGGRGRLLTGGSSESCRENLEGSP
jgi:hypothetical protein